MYTYTHTCSLYVYLYLCLYMCVYTGISIYTFLDACTCVQILFCYRSDSREVEKSFQNSLDAARSAMGECCGGSSSDSGDSGRGSRAVV